MDNISDNTCKSIFLHNSSELSEAFTELWTQFINDKEEKRNAVLHTDASGL